MYIAVNKIPTTPENRHRVAEGFNRALPGMKQFKGFLGMELWTAQDGSIQAVSRWESKEAVEEYLQNPLFSQHHGAPATGNSDLVAYYSVDVLA